MAGNAQMVESLLRSMTDTPRWIGYILGDAAQWGNIHIVRLLLARDFDVDQRLPWKQRRTPLSVAAEKGYVAIIEELLAKGANMEVEDENGRVALSWAMYSRKNTFQLLLDRGACVDSKDHSGKAPIAWAAEYGNQGAVERLLAKGARCTDEDSQGLTPLDYARNCGKRGIVDVILQHLSGLVAAYTPWWLNARWEVPRPPTAFERIVEARRKRWVS
jgi:ankyrin repeat protein